MDTKRQRLQTKKILNDNDSHSESKTPIVECDTSKNPESTTSREAASTSGSATPNGGTWSTLSPKAGEGLKLGEHGHIYQLELLMLCLWRAAHTQENGVAKYKQFRLATELSDAGKFDDILFQYRNDRDETKFRLFQAKHKEPGPEKPMKKITLQDLEATNDNDFSLPKYFHSYLNILQSSKESPIYSVFSGMEDKIEDSIEDLIVITNTDFNSEKEKNIFSNHLKIKEDDLLRTNKQDTVVCKLNNNVNYIEVKLLPKFKESSDFCKLVEKLADHIVGGKPVELKDVIKKYYYPLMKEIIVAREGKWIIDLSNHNQKESNEMSLSDEVTEIREALKKAVINKGKDKVPELRQVINVASGFADKFKPEEEPEIVDAEKFAAQMFNLIEHNKELKVIETGDKIKYEALRQQGKVDLTDQEKLEFRKNIIRLAGYVIIKLSDKLRFSSAFLKPIPDQLPGNIIEFRSNLEELFREKYKGKQFKFSSLSEYEFKGDKFKTCEDGELYRKLPVPIEKQVVESFFHKLKFVINYPNRDEISELLDEDLKNKLKQLDGKSYNARFYEKLHKWMADRVGTFYTAEEARKLFTSIKDGLSVYTTHGLNETFFAETSKHYKFKKLEQLVDFLSSDGQVLLYTCRDLYLGRTRIVQTFGSVDLQGYTPMFGHIFLSLNHIIESEDIFKILCKALGHDSLFNLVVIEWNKSLNESIINKWINESSEKLRTAIENSKNKKIIFITSYNVNLASVLPPTHDTIEDANRYQDLEEDSQKALLEQEIMLQGQKVRLKGMNNQSTKVIDKALAKLIKGVEIIVSSKPVGVCDLESSYSELIEEVDTKILIEKSSPEPRDIYIISGVPGSNKEESVTRILSSGQKSEMSKVEVAEWTKDTKEMEGGKLWIVSDDEFEDKDFRKICLKYPESRLYWIKLSNEKKFILQQIYNPDFYLEDRRFNNEVVIIKDFVKELADAEFSEIFIIAGKQKGDFINWLQLKDNKIEKTFEESCTKNLVQFVLSGCDPEATFIDVVERNKNITVHLLEFKMGQLVWNKTHGSLKSLCKYRAEEYKNIIPLINEEELLEKIRNERVVIFAGDPGMGKTTTLVKLYDSKFGGEAIAKSHWVIRINLKDRIEAIKKMNITDKNDGNKMIREIVEFLAPADKNDDFARGLLEIGLTEKGFAKPLLIAFDGFDEVLDKNVRSKIVSLSRHLIDDTRAKVWITTRLHCVRSLEAELSTFAVKLDPIATPAKFIKKYLCDRLSLISSDNVESMLEEYSVAFSNEISRVFQGDITKFIGTPLQLYLTLEGSVSRFRAWAGSGTSNVTMPNFSYLGNDIWEVYKNFVTRKYDIFFKKKGIIENETQNVYKFYIDRGHKDLAMFSINYKPTLKLSSDNDETVLSVGIVTSDGSDYQMIHPSFREYFAAKKIINWMIKWENEPNNVKEQTYFSKKILSEGDYKLIRAFLNAKLLNGEIRSKVKRELYDHKFLFLASKENNVGVAKFILECFEGSDIEARSETGKTALHIAAESGNLDMVKWLVQKGADVNANDNQWTTSLHSAAEGGYLDMAKWLVYNGADVNAKNFQMTTVLHCAAESGNLDMVKWLVQEGADLNAKDMYGKTVLHCAAESGNLDMVKWLVQEGADLNAKDMYRKTVLHCAAKGTSLDIVRWLVQIGADFNAKDMYGKTVLHCAAKGTSLDIVRWLIDNGADVNAEDKILEIVLEFDAQRGDLTVTQWLVGQGADVNAKDDHGTSVLHFPARSRKSKITQWLIDKGANFVNKDDHGTAVLHFPARSRNSKITRWLIDVGADVIAKDECGKTVLYFFVSSDRLMFSQWL